MEPWGLCVLLACRGRPYISLGSSRPAGGALMGQWDLCVLLACRGRSYISVGSSWPAGGALTGQWDLCVLLACRELPYITLGSSWPAGGAIVGGWGLLCPPGLQGAPLYLCGVLLACIVCRDALMPLCRVLPGCRGRSGACLWGSSRPAGGALISLWDPPGLHCL